jgi:hypothetical protein
LTADVADRCQDRDYAIEFGKALLDDKPLTDRTTGSHEADGFGRRAAQEHGILRDVSDAGAAESSADAVA